MKRELVMHALDVKRIAHVLPMWARLGGYQKKPRPEKLVEREFALDLRLHNWN